MNNIELLKNSRKILGLTQEKLAIQLGVNPVTVKRWETNVRSPAPEVFRTLLEMIVQRNIINQDRKSFIESTVKKLKQP